MVVPKSFVTKTLLEQSGVDIINKIRQVCECAHACVFLLCCLPSFSMSQRGEAESCVFSLWSGCRWDFGSSFHVPAHSGKIKDNLFVFSLWLFTISSLATLQIQAQTAFFFSNMSSSHSLFYLQADHLVRRGRPLVQQESVDLDIPEEKVAKRASTEILEGERLDDLESCMVGQSILEFSGFNAQMILICEGNLQLSWETITWRYVWVWAAAVTNREFWGEDCRFCVHFYQTH